MLHVSHYGQTHGHPRPPKFGSLRLDLACFSNRHLKIEPHKWPLVLPPFWGVRLMIGNSGARRDFLPRSDQGALVLRQGAHER